MPVHDYRHVGHSAIATSAAQRPYAQGLLKAVFQALTAFILIIGCWVVLDGVQVRTAGSSNNQQHAGRHTSQYCRATNCP